MSGGVLVAGIGNIFQTDDAFGVEVAARLSTRSLPPEVRVEDFGIRGLHLAYELLNGYDGLVLIDAVPMGEPAGTLAVIQPEIGDTSGPLAASATGDDMPPALDAHTMNPDVVLASLSHLGGSVEKIFIVGCQPADLQEGMGLTPAVAAAVDAAVDLCLELVSDLVVPTGKGTRS
ncbi:MAG TPA: hydrogenase maturation protease [Acidimicrobiales bacterium]